VNTADKKKLRAEAHALKPVVMIGQSGLTAAVLAELDIALNTHELLKVRIRAERDERKLIIEQLCTEAGAELIQTIGQIAVIYRVNPNK
jgi:RNA-binding protein